MKEIGKGVKEIWQHERALIVMMIVSIVMSVVLLVYSLVNLNPANSVTKVGYGDIGGYRDGSWLSMLAFPLFAVLVGGLHNLLTVKVYQKNGSGLAKIFVGISMLLILGAFVVLSRLLGES